VGLRGGQRIGMPALAVRTGGFSVDELCEAGAAEVFDSLDELRAAAPRLLG
jgi:phosphoglycolate phosphatase-like HAD superfamily hydrolase